MTPCLHFPMGKIHGDRMITHIPKDLDAFRARFQGFTVRPGIIDLHGDAFERHVAPRRGAVQDVAQGLFALDAELAANGITTAYLAQFWSWEGGMRGPDFARKLAAALDKTRPHLRTDMRLQLRVETSLIDDFDAITAFVDEHAISYVVFNDHLPHDALAKGKRPQRLTGQALKSGRSPEAHLKLLQELHERSPDVPKALKRFASDLLALGVRLGSHDDDSAKMRADNAKIGADIAEFPTDPAAVAAAIGQGAPVLLGAPNVVRGGSHSGGLSAIDAVEKGQCSALVSDYHYPSLRLAAQRLGSQTAWDLVARNPAAIMGLTDRGEIAPDRRADLCILDNMGRVAGTIVAGRWSFLTAPLADQVS